MGRQSNLAKLILARVGVQDERPEPVFPPRRACPAEAHKHPDYRFSCSRCIGRICERRAEIGLDDDGAPLRPKDRPRCGAKTRRGTACRARVVPGKRRCRFHGGASTGPKTPAGKARIAEAQRKRWARWRAGRA